MKLYTLRTEDKCMPGLSLDELIHAVREVLGREKGSNWLEEPGEQLIIELDDEQGEEDETQTERFPGPDFTPG